MELVPFFFLAFYRSQYERGGLRYASDPTDGKPQPLERPTAPALEPDHIKQRLPGVLAAGMAGAGTAAAAVGKLRSPPSLGTPREHRSGLSRDFCARILPKFPFRS